MNTKSLSVGKLVAVLLAVLVVISIFVTESEAARKPSGPRGCACHQKTKGCVIDPRHGPALGYKCKCESYYSAFLFRNVCQGTEFQCSPGENCPANCSTKECCTLGGGNCDGY